jgi:HK97 family phage major capsid protein
MEEALKKLKELREELGGKNTAIDAAIAKIEERIKTREAEAGEVKKALDKIREDFVALEKEHKDLMQSARTEALRREGFQDKEHALIVTGSMVRQLFNAQAPEDARVKVVDWEKRLLEQWKKDRATLLESGAVTGSYTVPTVFDVNIIDTLEQIMEISARADITMNLPGNVIIPTITGRPTFNHKRAAKSAAISKDAPAFGQVSMTPQEGTICFDVDNQLMVMSALDLGRLFVQLMQDSMMGALSVDLLMGDGTDTYNGITGILNVTDAEDVYAIGTEAPGGTTYQDIYEIEAKPLARCAARGVWLSSRSVFGVLAGINTTGKAPLLRFEGGKRYILEHDWVEALDMLTVAQATGKTKSFLAFGDLQSYKIGLQGGPRVSVSGHQRHEYNQTQFLLVCYYDIKRKHKRGMCCVDTKA